MNQENRFTVGLTGLSEDMEDFMLEQYQYYKDNFHKFYSSFWPTCVDMWQNGVDLTHKQMEIVEREYNKVKEKRIIEFNFIQFKAGSNWSCPKCNSHSIALNMELDHQHFEDQFRVIKQLVRCCNCQKKFVFEFKLSEVTVH